MYHLHVSSVTAPVLKDARADAALIRLDVTDAVRGGHVMQTPTSFGKSFVANVTLERSFADFTTTPFIMCCVVVSVDR